MTSDLSFNSPSRPGNSTAISHTTTGSSQHTPSHIRAAIAISLPQHPYSPASPVQLPWPSTANDDLSLHYLSLVAPQHIPPTPTPAILVPHLANHSLCSTNTIRRPFILFSSPQPHPSLSTTVRGMPTLKLTVPLPPATAPKPSEHNIYFLLACLKQRKQYLPQRTA